MLAACSSRRASISEQRELSLKRALPPSHPQVSASHLKSQCELCGGALANTVTPAALAKRLRVFRSIALYHGLPLLLHMVDWMLGNRGVMHN